MSLRRTIPRVPAPNKLEIHLTEVESTICDLLDDCTQYLRKEKGLSVTCRIAGGWVRDKLLGSQSNDMDVALSDIMGLAFAEFLADFAHSKGVTTGAITKIEQNPDQSKHLETATFKILGLDLDLVNLRSEEYAEGSRIPTGVAFGTPLEDALRRDITINALFYNVHTRKVEDFTKKGLDDIAKGLIRTPMPPRETFQDDPLRVLRCVRFSSRFGFEVAQEVKDAVKDPQIQDALVLKVARERVGDEVGKMIKGRDPLHAAQLIYELSLYHSIFSVIPSEAKLAMETTFATRSLDATLAAPSVLNALTHFEPCHPLVPHRSLLDIIRSDSATKARIYLATLLILYLGITYQDAKNKTHLVVTAVIRDSLKLGSQNHYLDGIPALFSAVSLIKAFMLGNHPSLDRVKLGLLLRDKYVHNAATGSHWTTSLLFSMVTELVPFYNVQNDQFNVDAAAKVISSYTSFAKTITELGLDKDVDAKPLLNGCEVGEVFGMSTRGPWIGKALQDVTEWQLGHPSGSKSECIEWLKGRGTARYITEEDLKSKPAKRIRTK
ncbi:hypothetical protein BDN70DRAFT_888834 [Pholiota conissans]|uniref:Poly A polymerase head domain-containing protein n=1 Tax=Pholiota conissans TaxID=109636 RepID=A0A9P5YIZ2_9AGAR|nr:hypothetical protein BDN70DRAFT_888834 [Pholiota conissans]